MLQQYSIIISIILTIGFLYKKTKDITALFSIIMITIISIGSFFYDYIYPLLPFEKQIHQKLALIIAILILAVIFVVFITLKKEKALKYGKENNILNFRVLLKLSMENIVFWAVIIIINLIAFLIDK